MNAPIGEYCGLTNPPQSQSPTGGRRTVGAPQSQYPVNMYILGGAGIMSATNSSGDCIVVIYYDASWGYQNGVGWALFVNGNMTWLPQTTTSRGQYIINVGSYTWYSDPSASNLSGGYVVSNQQPSLQITPRRGRGNE